MSAIPHVFGLNEKYRDVGDEGLAAFTLSLPKVNLAKPRKLLNPELSNQT